MEVPENVRKLICKLDSMPFEESLQSLRSTLNSIGMETLDKVFRTPEYMAWHIKNKDAILADHDARCDCMKEKGVK